MNIYAQLRLQKGRCRLDNEANLGINLKDTYVSGGCLAIVPFVCSEATYTLRGFWRLFKSQFGLLFEGEH